MTDLATFSSCRFTAAAFFSLYRFHRASFLRGFNSRLEVKLPGWVDLPETWVPKTLLATLGFVVGGVSSERASIADALRE